jgi:hypothetical protein
MGAATPAVPVLHYSTASTDAAPGGGWVHVWKAADPFEANLIVGKLQDQGLHARVDMENAAALGAWGGVGAGGTTVQALAADAAAVRAILEQIDRDRARRRDAGSLACPACGHRPAKGVLHPARKGSAALFVAVPFVAGVGVAVESGPVGGAAAFATLGLAVVMLFVNVVPRWRCPACDHRWAEPDPPAADEDDD